MLQAGTLRLRPLSATLLHNTEHFGKMDPYVIFRLGTQTKKTLAAKKQHLNPVWDEEVVFDLNDNFDSTLDVILKHKELIHDDLIGQGTINLSTWLSGNKGVFSEWIPLFYKEKDAGSLLLEMNFTPFNAGTGVIQAPLGTATTNIVQQPVMTTTPTTMIEETPIVHSETVTVREQPVFIQEQPLVYEKETIREKPIIHEKEIVECTQPIIVEKPELRENIMHQRKDAITIQDQPILRTETGMVGEMPNLQGALISKETEYQKEAGTYIHERPELYTKEIVTEKPIIHEKDIIHVEKPVFVEKPELITREFQNVEAPVFTSEQPLIHAEKQLFTNTQPVLHEEPLVHVQQPEFIQANPSFVKERADIYEKQIIHEKPIIHEQPILHTQKEVIHEMPEFKQTRIIHQEAPILKQEELLHQRRVQGVDQTLDPLLNKPKGDQTAFP